MPVHAQVLPGTLSVVLTAEGQLRTRADSDSPDHTGSISRAGLDGTVHSIDTAALHWYDTALQW